MNVTELLVKCLETEGVRYVFGVPGEETEELLFALEDSPITFVPCRHEQGAAFIANVWGRLTGRVGVCLSTLGPGATNLITGVADANLDKAPVVAITAQGGLSRMHQESHQRLDILSMFKAITKWNSAIGSPRVVSEVVRKAVKLAEYEKPGATHIELSEDVAAEVVDTNQRPIAPIRAPRPNPDNDTIDRAVSFLREAKRPLVIVGNGAIRDNASEPLRALSSTHGIPVVSTFMGKGIVSDRSEQSLMTMGLGFRDFVMEAIQAADLILTAGYDIVEYPPHRWNPDATKRILHFDTMPADVYRHYNPLVEVIGSLSSGLASLDRKLTASGEVFDREWYGTTWQRIRDDIDGYRNEHARFTIPGTLNVLRRIMEDDGILISDVGSHKLWISRNFPTYRPNGCIVSNGLASMGIALPGAIAAKLIDPARQVVAAMGDGGFLMNSQELETAKRLGVGFTALIFNDNDYGLISWKQKQSRGRSTSTRLSNPDFRAYAESFGIRGYRPRTSGELEDQLSAAVTLNELAVIEVPVDARVNQDLISKLQMFWDSREESPDYLQANLHLT
jgi:acetolactate synthase-1/2/3 large subunit